MTSITIKNVPEELHLQLQEVAKAHNRSLNSEIITLLENSLGSQLCDTNTMLKQAKLLRSEVKGYLTDKDLKALKDEGRP